MASESTPSRTRRLGRPTCYSEALAEDICCRLMEGESLRTICASKGMPVRTTVLRWVEVDPVFRSAYIEARQVQQQLLGYRTDLLRKRLPAGIVPWPVYMQAKERLQTNLRRVGQLKPKRQWAA